jgi:hypothetical protein
VFQQENRADCCLFDAALSLIVNYIAKKFMQDMFSAAGFSVVTSVVVLSFERRAVDPLVPKSIFLTETKCGGTDFDRYTKNENVEHILHVKF